MLAKLLLIVVRIALLARVFLFGVLLHLLQVVVELLLELGDQLVDLFVFGTLLQRLRQLILRVLQRAFRVGQRAVFDRKRELPKLFDGFVDGIARAFALDAIVHRPQAKIDAGRFDEAFGFQRQRRERAGDGWTIAGIFRQQAALFDDGAGERLLEAARRQDHFDRCALSDLAADVGRLQPQFNALTGPRVLAEFEQRLAFERLGAGARNLERQNRRTLERQARPRELRRLSPGFGLVRWFRLELAHFSGGGSDAVVVFGGVRQLHRTTRRAIKLLGVERDLRQLIGDDRDGPACQFPRAGNGADTCRFANFMTDFGEPRVIASFRRV